MHDIEIFRFSSCFRRSFIYANRVTSLEKRLGRGIDHGDAWPPASIVHRGETKVLGLGGRRRLNADGIRPDRPVEPLARGGP